MRTLLALISVAALSLVILNQATAADASGDHTSKYAGQENRKIKSLSPDDIIELQKGGGVGPGKSC